jgi:hypothetical protein
MLKRLAIAAVLIALLFRRPCVSEQQQGSAHSTQAKAGQTQKPIPPTHVVIDPPLPASNGQPPAPTETNTPQEKPLPRFIRPEWVIVYVTVVYAILAWLTLRTIRKQADWMGTQAGYMKDQTEVLRNSVAAAQASAEAAKAQIEMMKEKERARLSVKPPPSLPAFNVRQQSWGLTISLPVKNDGPTQAVSIGGIAVAVASGDSKFAKDDWDFVSIPSEIGGGEGFPVTVPLSHQFIGRTVPERFYVHVWGRIEYRDIFEEEKIHSAPFGFRCKMKQIRGDGMAVQDGEWWGWGHPAQGKVT